MPIPSPHKKAPKGTVVVESFKGRLRLRFRVAGDRYCLAIGLPDLPENREIAHEQAAQIALDIKMGSFDPSLAKYQKSKRVKAAKNQPMLDILWDKYTEFKRKQIETPKALKNYSRFHQHVRSSVEGASDQIEASSNGAGMNWTPDATRRVLSDIIESTSSINDYQRFRNYIESLPSKNLNNAIEIWKHICTTQSSNSAKHILTQIDICCEWAARMGFLSCNPFKQLGDCEEFNQTMPMPE